MIDFRSIFDVLDVPFLNCIGMPMTQQNLAKRCIHPSKITFFRDLKIKEKIIIFKKSASLRPRPTRHDYTRSLRSLVYIANAHRNENGHFVRAFKSTSLRFPSSARLPSRPIIHDFTRSFHSLVSRCRSLKNTTATSFVVKPLHCASRHPPAFGPVRPAALTLVRFAHSSVAAAH